MRGSRNEAWWNGGKREWSGVVPVRLRARRRFALGFLRFELGDYRCRCRCAWWGWPDLFCTLVAATA